MYKLKNYTEELISNMMSSILDNYNDICKCDKCILDMKALALNSLQPRYIVTQEGEIFSKIELVLNNQEVINITTALTEAIEKVSKNPKH